jgi:hypothetical protein
VIGRFRIGHGPAGVGRRPGRRRNRRARGKPPHRAARPPGNRWPEVPWHCPRPGTPHDEAVHTATRNRTRKPPDEIDRGCLTRTLERLKEDTDGSGGTRAGSGSHEPTGSGVPGHRRDSGPQSLGDGSPSSADRGPWPPRTRPGLGAGKNPHCRVYFPQTGPPLDANGTATPRTERPDIRTHGSSC